MKKYKEKKTREEKLRREDIFLFFVKHEKKMETKEKIEETIMPLLR